MNLIERAVGYFLSHPTVNEFHFTSDGLAFPVVTDAEAHARSLPDRKVIPIKRYPDEAEADEYRKMMPGFDMDSYISDFIARTLDLAKDEEAKPAIDFSDLKDGTLTGIAPIVASVEPEKITVEAGFTPPADEQPAKEPATTEETEAPAKKAPVKKAATK